MLEALQYPFFQRALLAGVLASIACGVVGSYVVVKRMASISGGLSHAAFGGVGLGYLLGIDPMISGTAFALISGLGIGLLYRRVQSGLDTVIAMMWAVGMALGILFVSLSPGYAPDLMSYLFGSILFVPMRYLYWVIALDIVILIVVTLVFKNLRAVAFDQEFAEVMGLPVQAMLLILLGLASLAVVTLIGVVGVILVIALLTIPAATAQQWAVSLQRMMVVASVIGAFCTVIGLFLSYWLSDAFDVNVPTGPLIILIAVSVYGVSSAARSLAIRNA